LKDSEELNRFLFGNRLRVEICPSLVELFLGAGHIPNQNLVQGFGFLLIVVGVIAIVSKLTKKK